MNRAAFDKWVDDGIVEDMRMQIVHLFKALIFAPLVESLHEFTSVTARLNISSDSLRDALRTGRVQYDPVAGVVSGSFDAALTRYLILMGATWDKRRKVFNLPHDKAPAWLAAEAGMYKIKAQDAHGLMERKLEELQKNSDALIDLIKIDPRRVVEGAAKGYRKISQALGVDIELSPEAQARMAREYTESLKLPIKTFTQKMTGSLREVVQDNASAGYRYDKLVAGIEQRYQVSKSKAEFLARQESTLFLAAHRRARLADGGITSYMWSTSHDERVRDDHKKLNGLIFTYDNPPVVNTLTGKRANPGEDYGCRCIDRPNLSRIKEAA